MTYKYAYQGFNKETMARASSTNVHISLKKATETAKFLKNKKVSSVIKFLEAVIVEKAVVPFRKYNSEMPHKRGKGIAAGGYPVKVAQEFLKLIKSAEKNANEQEIADELYVISVSVRKGAQRYHNGRHFGRKMKSTNVEVIVGIKEKKKTVKNEGSKK